MLHRYLCTLPLLLLALTAGGTVTAEPIAFVDEDQFLAAAAALGWSLVQEGFEDDSYWGSVRTSIVDGVHSAPAVTAQSLVWTANNLSSEITTSEGAARSGAYGVYSYPHGSYGAPDPGTDCYVPGECGDGLRGRPEAGMLRAVGGWVWTNTPYAKIGGNWKASWNSAAATSSSFSPMISPSLSSAAR